MRNVIGDHLLSNVVGGVSTVAFEIVNHGGHVLFKGKLAQLAQLPQAQGWEAAIKSGGLEMRKITQ